jgi:hypothetical protein
MGYQPIIESVPFAERRKWKKHGEHLYHALYSKLSLCVLSTRTVRAFRHAAIDVGVK